MSNEPQDQELLEAVRAGLQDRLVSVVSKVTGLSIPTIRNVKFGGNNKPNRTTVSVLADYLGVTKS
jgi:hypothetical protein